MGLLDFLVDRSEQNKSADLKAETPISPVPVYTPTPGGPAKQNPEVFEDFLKIINSVESFSKLDVTIKSLENIIQDEGSRFRAALNAINANSQTPITKEQLLEDLKSAKQKIDAETSNFNGSVENIRSTELANMQTKVDQMNSEISTLEQEILEKTTRIGELRGKITEEQTRSSDEIARLNSSIADFNFTLSDVTRIYDAICKKIELYLSN